MSKSRTRQRAIQKASLLVSALVFVIFLASQWAQVSRLTQAPLRSAEPAPPPELAPHAAEPARPAAAPLSCAEPMEHTELWGEVVKPGTGPGATVAPTAADCCALCATTRGCNVWVACSDARACGEQCWLKWQEDPTRVVKHSTSLGTPWTSGVHAKDYADPSNPYEPGGAEVVTLRTAEGALRIRLHDDWSLGSTTYVRKVARHDLCTARCHFYRAEPGFLLQGALHAVIPANTDKARRGEGVPMQRGDVAWAGGFAGPDFFITHVRVPGFGASHTVWGSLDGEESFAVLDRLVALPASSGPKGGMRMITQPPAFEAVVEP